MKNRNKIYRKALKLIEERYEFVCNAISIVSVDFKEVTPDTYPELFMFKDSLEPDTWAWLGNKTEKADFLTTIHSETGMLTRQIVLDFCILMTEK